jgi:hypothetical protein
VRGHDHALDGTLHEGCEECALIVDRYPTIQREKQADAMAERFRQIAGPKEDT